MGFSDWPGPGPIDLDVHDLPHESSELEWWYVNGHMTTDDNQQFSIFAAFFRVLQDELVNGKKRYSHHLTWGITDPNNQKYLPAVLVDPLSPEDAVKELKKEKLSKDPKIRKAFIEIFEKGNVPLPDQLLQRDAQINLNHLELDFDGNRFFKCNNHYELELFDKRYGNGCKLSFIPQIPPVRYGINAEGTSAEKFYYFIPRCELKGELILNHKNLPVKAGKGWYDHEFGLKGSISNWAWNWLAIQFDNDWELSLYDLINMDENKKIEQRLIIIDPKGKQQDYKEFTFEPKEHWLNTSTFNSYPVLWQLTVPENQISLQVKAIVFNQECLTMIAPRGFWEGRVEVSGTWNGQPVKGLGYVERTGFNNIEFVEDFLKLVGNETKNYLIEMFPEKPSFEQATKLLASEERKYVLEEVDIRELWNILINPIREIVNKGGKAWRSYIVLAIQDLLEKDSNKYKDLLILPELLHIGSLIIDDVQDHSEMRRGGPTTYKVYGEALAINAGSICYFLALIPTLKYSFSAEKKIYMYENYLETMRSAHAGQALDIKGLQHLIDEAVKTGDVRELEGQLLAIHRLKSGVVPAALGRVSAFIADGNQEQIETIGNYLESLGVAFQIIDDVLNLEGFANNLKTKGEDISEGKVTAPIIKAMSHLSLEDRQLLWEILSSKSTDPKKINIVIKLLEKCNAFKETRQFAENIIEQAWLKMDKLFPDSFIKVRLRTFGWFILEQHY